MTIKTGLHPFTCIFFLIIAIYASSSSAAPSVAMGYTPKYAENFKHFDYVSADAKKGGRLVLAGTGAFDRFNPFILKKSDSNSDFLICGDKSCFANTDNINKIDDIIKNSF